ncbi:putative T7SS-secreted protein [Humibacter sp. RRB41]|uniref:putative T7SS-secreted protein n=1 Tax=Humibacter sp. RRB41 TaxID=2919946 RepID=UPI001FAA3184|nr:hypothetical protein [Humibacter sp. RRB41]
MSGQSELAPLPGDPAALKTKADGLSSAAEQIQQAINHLRKLSDHDETVSLAIDSVRGNASDVADNITKAQVRYAGTAKALQDYAPKLESAQQRALRAITAYNGAQQQVDSAHSSQQHQQEQYQHDQATAPAPAPGADAPKSFADTPAGTRANQAVSDANDAVSAALKEYHEAIAEVDSAAQTAISQIKKAIHDSGLNDGFWDKLGHALSSAWNDAVAWAKKYLAPVLDVIQRVAAAIADIGGYLAMVLNILAVFIPVLAPIAAAVDIIVLAAAAVSFLTTAALVGLGDRSLGDLLNTGITLVASALPIKGDAAALTKAGKLTGVAEKLTTGKLGEVINVADKLNGPLDKFAKFVGKGGAALGEKAGSKYLGALGSSKAADYAAAAFHGSLEHGTSLDRAGENAIAQYRHGMTEGIREATGGAAEKATTAVVNTTITTSTVNAGAAVDNFWDGHDMPGHDYFQTHSALEIQPLIPNVHIVPNSDPSTLGGLNPLNILDAGRGVTVDASHAMAHAVTGTATLE